VLAGIFLGQITRWNDPRIVADNPVLVDLEQPISVVHRSDGSGTTHIFTSYLAAVSPSWSQQVGVGASVRWPVGVGGIGNPGVTELVARTNYSIGYVELIYAMQNNLGVPLIQNQAGRFVAPTLKSVTAAAATTDVIAPEPRSSIVNAHGADAYPISGFTYQLVYQHIPDRGKGMALAPLLWWEIHEGQSFNADLWLRSSSPVSRARRGGTDPRSRDSAHLAAPPAVRVRTGPFPLRPTVRWLRAAPARARNSGQASAGWAGKTC
jgi:phosphate transport system substrate-binding protein